MISLGINGLGIANKAGSRPSLNLDFINSQIFDPRITFTRASTATRVNANGLIEVVASGSPRIDFDPATQVCKGLLIEEQRTNLLTYSENFDNAGWGRQGSIVTATNILAPDGTYTAEYIDNNAGTTSLVYEVVAVTASSTNDYYASIFVKRGTNNTFTMNCYYDGNTEDNVSFNFDNLGAAGAPYVGEYIFQSFGNGWYRCGYRVTRDSTGSKTGLNFRLWQSGRGVATGGLNIWGAQLEVGAFPTSYIPSSDTFTSRASTATYVGSNGLIQSALTNVARYDYNPVNLALAPKLLLESASTNLLTYSEQFDNAAWNKVNVTIVTNAIIAPDGTLTADAPSRIALSNSYLVGICSTTTHANKAYTFSIYIKAGTLTGDITLRIRDGAGIADIASAILTPTATWTRYWVTGTFEATPVANINVYIDPQNNTGVVGDTFYIWGAQLEAGSFPTSYIPTVASQATRAADISTSAQTTRVADNAVMTGTNFSSWYNQTEGTVVANADSVRKSGSSPIICLQVAGGNDRHQLGLFTIFSATVVGGIVQSLIGANALQTAKTAYAYRENSFAACANGGTQSTNSSGAIPTSLTYATLGRLDFGGGESLNGHISKLSYYPKRLTNSELQALTTG